MSYLISRSALWKAFDFCGVFIERRDRHIAQGMVEDAPAIEAVPVVHGEWLETRYYTWECSACGFHPFKGYIPKNPDFKFCPNCGAKMDGDYAQKHLEAVRDRMKRTGLTNEEMEGHFFGKDVE